MHLFDNFVKFNNENKKHKEKLNSELFVLRKATAKSENLVVI